MTKYSLNLLLNIIRYQGAEKECSSVVRMCDISVIHLYDKVVVHPSVQESYGTHI